MAHPPEVKAEALALLLLGNSHRYVSEQTGVPRSTIRRWDQTDARAWRREILASHPELRNAVRLFRKNGPKKKERESGASEKV